MGFSGIIQRRNKIEKGMIMTTRFRKKVRKWRGRTSHGWGAKKKHRGGGSQGGRGYAGRHKHKYSYVVSKEPDYYGYKGFYSRKIKGKAINIDELNRLSNENEIDLSKLGFSKLLSRGKVSKPLTINVAAASSRAREKIEKSGGKIIIEGNKKLETT